MKYIIYRISVADYTYIGSTKDFKQRKIEHKSACSNINSKSHNCKVYQIVRENGGWENCEIIPIEEYECENNIQAHIREEYWRREYDAKMNTYKAHRTDKEIHSYKVNMCKEWYEKNKLVVLETLKEKQKEKITCECGSVICKVDKHKHLKTKKHLAFVASNTIDECISCGSAYDL